MTFNYSLVDPTVEWTHSMRTLNLSSLPIRKSQQALVDMDKIATGLDTENTGEWSE